jgi:AAA domain
MEFPSKKAKPPLSTNDNVAKPDTLKLPDQVKADLKVTDDSINAETLLGMTFPPLEYVIPGYLVEGLTVLGGRPKLGKSWLAYDASIAVATGGKAMGSVQCEQGDVIYLALEDNRRRVKDRLLTLCPLRKSRKINLDRLTVRTVAPRIDTGLMAELDKWRLGCKKPRLIIIDVFLKVRPPRKKGEDPYSADYDAVTPLQRYASEHRLAVVLVTHTRKMAAEDPLEAINGTNGITGAADTVLVLNRDAKGTTLYGRGRDIEEIETAMQFDGGRWSILGDADEVRKSDERRKIIAALKENGEEMGPKAIADATGMKADNVRKLLRKMVASGEIVQPRVGFYTVPFSKPPEE